MDREQLQSFTDTARRFARREVAPMVGTRDRDGDLTRLTAVLGRAAEAGLLASADPTSPGHEYGVWGRASLADGPAASLAVLAEVARACAGVAACLHAAGLGAREAPVDTDWPLAVGLFDTAWRPSFSHLISPPAAALSLQSSAEPARLSGRLSFVLAAPATAGYVVWAAGPAGWERVLVPAGAAGLTVIDAGPRTGLAALQVTHLRLTDVSTPDSRAPGDPLGYVARLLLGQAAIAVGNARGALETAEAYAAERYQGGRLIKEHPAVQLLLGDSHARIQACEAHLAGLAAAWPPGGGAPPEPAAARATLVRAAAARLRCADEACEAVTQCLQVLGGYGYMEDYRLEKRLRDALTLKTQAIRPDDLRLLCANGGAS